MNDMTDMPNLETWLGRRLAETPDGDRIGRLRPLADAVVAARSLDLVFICTHNSRRSHLAQVWAAVAARRFGLGGVRTYSGGTEATAFDRRAVDALERAGLAIERGTDAENPVHVVRGPDGLVQECFSKHFGHPANPGTGFTAVMTCTDADEACPVVPGAASRFSIPYVDPKKADGTSEESATYDVRCAQIAAEMLWVMREAADRS